MKLDFNISELVITGNSIPLDVADKLLQYHILPMQEVRNGFTNNVLNDEEKETFYITASLKSGYRPKQYEISKGRSGNSQHTFQGKGAVDWTCYDFNRFKHDLIHYIIHKTDYTRIAVYNSFVHCDYKGEERQLFNSDSNSNWEFVRNI